MSIFQKKQNEELFSLIENDSDMSENLFPDSFFNKNPSPNALTPEEVLMTGSALSDETENTNALEALKKRMLDSRNSNNNQNNKSDCEEQEKSDENPAPQNGNSEFDINIFSNRSDKEILKGDAKEPDSEKEPPQKTLLEKCRPFILDDEGKDSAMKSAPTYKLESVAEILNNESKKTLDKLSEKYDISFDDLGKYSGLSDGAGDRVQKITEEPPEREVFEEKMPSADNARTDISHIISDIDNPISEKAGEADKDISSTATIKFTPVSDSDSTARISVSSKTRPIDLTGEFSQLDGENEEELTGELRLEQTEFEEYIPKEEFKSEKNAKHFLRILSLKKRASFLKTFFSVILTLALTAADLPFMSGIILGHTKICMIICTAILGIIILLNIDIFKSFAKIFSRRSTPDIFAATASLFVLAYAVAGILKNEITLNIILLCAVTLCVRSLCRFLNCSYMLSNFRQIAGPSPKRAVKLISDQAVTFAMAKDSIEGDVLAAAPQRTSHIDDFIKYSTFGVVLGGKLPIITCVSLLMSVIIGFSCASYFDGLIYGFYSAAAVQCFAAMPIIFLIDNLPLYSAAKRLNRLGAMISGKTGAEHTEKANAVVLSAEDLFPSGTVTLHQMKLLSDNSIDDTIIRAASVTDALGSPLAPIFKKIAGSAGDFTLPESDTVKYEDRMGISGWVDNKFLFVGNRTLLEAHGIDVPGVETDKKLLRQGFFPVYVAADGKACALLAVQYSVKPEIARELRKLSALGVTMLINSSDPNLTEEMICDYMGLYDDSVKVMSSAGCHMYKNAVTFTEKCSAPAAYKGNPLGLPAIINSANRIRKSNILLTVLYSLTSILGAVLFTYMSFDGSGSLTGSLTVLLYGLVCTAVSYILYLTQKP